MKRFIVLFLAVFFLLSFCVHASYAKSSNTWSNIGKGLAIYEGAKVVTGRQGNILDDVTGGMQPRQGSSQGGTYQDGYNAGYQAGYDAGFKAGLPAGRQGVERSK